MKVLKWIFIVIGIIIAAALIIALFLPGQVSIESQIKVGKAPAKVFHSLALYQERQAWDPWLTQDSTALVDIAPAEGYVGSTYEWEGEVTGKGKMEIDSVEYAKHISASIWFDDQPEPALVTWDFQDEGDSTAITWGFHADAGYPMGRLFLNLMKGALQEDLDQGLSNLKSHMESTEISLSEEGEITPAALPEKTALVVSASGTMDEITPQFESMFGQVMAAVEEQGLQMAGAPFCYYTDYNPEDMTTTAYCGVPVVEGGEDSGEVKVMTFPSVSALKMVHKGPYDDLESAYTRMMDYVTMNDIPVTWNAWEVYVNDPMVVKYPTLYETEIYMEVE